MKREPSCVTLFHIPGKLVTTLLEEQLLMKWSCSCCWKWLFTQLGWWGNLLNGWLVLGLLSVTLGCVCGMVWWSSVSAIRHWCSILEPQNQGDNSTISNSARTVANKLAWSRRAKLIRSDGLGFYKGLIHLADPQGEFKATSCRLLNRCPRSLRKSGMVIVRSFLRGWSLQQMATALRQIKGFLCFVGPSGSSKPS